MDNWGLLRTAMAKEFIHFVIWGAQNCSSQGHLCNLMGIQGPPLSCSSTAFEVEDTYWCQWTLDQAPGSSVNLFTNFSLQETTHNSVCHFPQEVNETCLMPRLSCNGYMSWSAFLFNSEHQVEVGRSWTVRWPEATLWAPLPNANNYTSKMSARGTWQKRRKILEVK